MRFMHMTGKWPLMILAAACLCLTAAQTPAQSAQMRAQEMKAGDQYFATLSKDDQVIDNITFQATNIALNGEDALFLLPYSRSRTEQGVQSSFQPVTAEEITAFLKAEGVGVKEFKAWLKEFSLNPERAMEMAYGYQGSKEKFVNTLYEIKSVLGARDPAVQFFSDFLDSLGITMQEFEDALAQNGLTVPGYVALMDKYAVDFLTLLQQYYRSGSDSFDSFLANGGASGQVIRAAAASNSAGEYYVENSKWNVYCKPFAKKRSDGAFTRVVNKNDTDRYGYQKNAKDYKLGAYTFGFARHPVGYHFYIKFNFNSTTGEYSKAHPENAPGRYIVIAEFPVVDIFARSELFGYAALDHVYAYGSAPINMGVSQPAAQIDITVCFKFRAMGESIQRTYKYRLNAESGPKCLDCRCTDCP